MDKQQSKEEHYLLGGDYYHPIFNFFMPNVLPRYIVINERMNLADYYAPLPSKGNELYLVINEIMKK